MVADPGYLPPHDYSVTWPVLGGFILLGLLIWVMVIWMLTRRPEDSGHAAMPPQALTNLRREALSKIDEIDHAVGTQGIPPRQGHHALSRIVRDFVGRASDLEAETMTAADLRERGPAHLADLIERFYPRQFGAAEAELSDFAGSADAARHIVRGWHG